MDGRAEMVQSRSVTESPRRKTFRCFSQFTATHAWTPRRTRHLRVGAADHVWVTLTSRNTPPCGAIPVRAAARAIRDECTEDNWHALCGYVDL